jgi:PBP1b-binding outer membrane lipoprotein LpoB
MIVPALARAALCAAALSAPLDIAGCGETTVDRTDPNAVRDLSGNWNATDSQQVATTIIADVTTDPWLDKFREKNGRDPVIKVGKVDVVASSDESAQAREERKDQDINASAETRKESFQESGADYLLEGAIEVQHDQAGNEKQKFYAIDLSLTDIKSQKLVWEGGTKIAKDVNRAKYK